MRGLRQLAYSWHCLEDDCDAHGTGDRSDLEARKHETATHPGHATAVVIEPV